LSAFCSFAVPSDRVKKKAAALKANKGKAATASKAAAKDNASDAGEPFLCAQVPKWSATQAAFASIDTACSCSS
jgi:hypothetical protein